MVFLETFMHETVTAQFPAPQACMQLSIFTAVQLKTMPLCAFVLLPKTNCNKVFVQLERRSKEIVGKNDLNEVKVCRCIM